MNQFLHKHAKYVIGILSGFDRLIFRGSLKKIAYPNGMMQYLFASQVLLKDFAKHVETASEQVKSAALSAATKQDRPIIYLNSSKGSKEEQAKAIMKRDQITQDLVCVFTAVEPCMSYGIVKNRNIQKLELAYRPRKCLHVYQYWIDPIFGFMNARIQTWFPFQIQICLNGREWLSRQMDQCGILYLRRDNCFTRINNIEKTQDLMSQQLNLQWPDHLDRIAKKLNPAFDQIFKEFPASYYWSTFQSEWATDVMFKNRASLDSLYPSLVQHGLTTFQSPDVMRFLGHHLNSDGSIHGKFKGEVTSDVKERHEGVRIKHRLNGNSIKAYNKEGSILRIETTINRPDGFKVLRPKQDQDEQSLLWLPMRKGVMDLKRRAIVSQASNDRYLDALAMVDVSTPMKSLVQDILKPAFINEKRVRAINPWSEGDAILLETVIRGEFSINGFRNRDLRPFLFPQPQNKEEEKKQSGAMSRKLRLLRAHKLIKKVPHTHRYQLTDKGRILISSLIAARNADANQLSKIAA